MSVVVDIVVDVNERQQRMSCLADIGWNVNEA